MNERWAQLAQGWKGALGKYKYVLLVMALGVFLLLLPSGSGSKELEVVAQGGVEQFDLPAFEQKLAQALSQIGGAGTARVVLTVDSGTRQVLAQDQERDTNGSYTAQTVTVGRGSGQQEVVALQLIAPSFRGALVVCPGGSDPQVRLKVMQAVSALTGLGANRISICEGNS